MQFRVVFDDFDFTGKLVESKRILKLRIVVQNQFDVHQTVGFDIAFLVSAKWQCH